MKKIKTEQAIGQVLCHDMTQIIPGVTKDARFRKGHIVAPEDIPVLLSMGKEYLYIWEKDDTKYHENEAAKILCSLCISSHMEQSDVKEGKIEITAAADGLLKVDTARLDAVNSLGDIMIAGRHPDTAVKHGDKICGTRIIPLVIEKKKMEEAVSICKGEPIYRILPFHPKRAGIVTTGKEVFTGRIRDAFGPVLTGKLQEYGTQVFEQVITDDEPEHITAAIKALIQKGADMVFCTGGMSVDPDDSTPLAIKNTGADIVTYGVPVLPGAMFLLSYYEGAIPVVGLPGCVMYAKRTILDLVLPRLIAEDKVKKEELNKLGKGGLCLSCEVCHFPNCGFGKGY